MVMGYIVDGSKPFRVVSFGRIGQIWNMPGDIVQADMDAVAGNGMSGRPCLQQERRFCRHFAGFTGGI